MQIPRLVLHILLQVFVGQSRIVGMFGYLGAVLGLGGSCIAAFRNAICRSVYSALLLGVASEAQVK
jgi:hypothetical protein